MNLIGIIFLCIEFWYIEKKNRTAVNAHLNMINESFKTVNLSFAFILQKNNRTTYILRSYFINSILKSTEI